MRRTSDAAHDRARRRKQEREANDVRQKSGRDQEGAAEDHEHPVDDLTGGHPALRQDLVEAAPDRPTLRPQQPRAEQRVRHQEQDRPPDSDGVAHLQDHVQLRERDDQEEECQGPERHGLTLLSSCHGNLTVDDVQEALTNVIDPELGLDFVELGLIYSVEIEDSDVFVSFTLTSPGCRSGRRCRSRSRSSSASSTESRPCTRR